jgi:AraC-like DNA-binding protein
VSVKSRSAPRVPRTPKPGSRHPEYTHTRLRDALESYMRWCFEERTAARVSEFAERVGRSRPYVSRLYLRVFGKSVRDLMRDIQVRRAEQLLRSGHRSIAEVAEMSGFGTVMTLYRVFASLRGAKPTEFQRKVTK